MSTNQSQISPIETSFPKYQYDQETTLTTSTTENSSSSDTSSPTSQETLFESYYDLYYVDSSKNTPITYDFYLQNALTLISHIPTETDFSNKIKHKSLSIPHSFKKQTLILDMDETLVHTDVKFEFKYHDEILKFICEDEEIILPIILRPHLFTFLDFVSQYFELIIFTASEQEYADVILDYIEKDKKYFNMRLYRNSCVNLFPGLLIKDLSIFTKRNIENIIIVDNSLFSFANQINNGVLVSSFYNDKDDSMLLNLISYLGMLIGCEDVREENKKYFMFENYLNTIKGV